MPAGRNPFRLQRADTNPLCLLSLGWAGWLRLAPITVEESPPRDLTGYSFTQKFCDQESRYLFFFVRIIAKLQSQVNGIPHLLDKVYLERLKYMHNNSISDVCG